MAPPNVRDQQVIRETVKADPTVNDYQIMRELIHQPPNGAYVQQVFREVIMIPGAALFQTPQLCINT